MADKLQGASTTRMAAAGIHRGFQEQERQAYY